jgi:hypothetical protein
MHGKVLRGGPGDLSLRLSCITRPTGYISPWSVYTLRTFTCRLSTDPVIWRVRPCQSVFLLNQYYIFNILNMIKIFNPNLNDYDTMPFSV